MNFSQIFKTNPISRLLLLLDIIGIAVCFNIAHNLRVDVWVSSTSVLVFIIIATLMCLYTFNTYTIEAPNKALRVVSRTILASLVAFLIAILTGFLIGREAFIPLFGRTILFVGFMLFIIWASLFRYLAIRLNFRTNDNRWLFIGNQNMATEFHRDFDKHKYTGVLDCYIVDQSVESNGANISEYQKLISKPWNGVIIDSLNTLTKDIAADLLQQRLSGMRIFSLTEFYSKQWTKVPIFYIGQQWLMDVDGFSLLEDSVNFKLKRVFDILFSIFLGALVLPIMLIIGLCIRLTSVGPAFYKQRRVGLNGKEYYLYKFRTMQIDAEKEGPRWTSIDDPRITQLGSFLRRTRLDELPQIYNVLLGQMSFIGPRPERPEFVANLEKEIPYYDLRHLVKPGITGWAQVMFDYGASQEDAREKLQYDLFYIKNQSVLLDSIILLKTLKTVMNAKGR